MGSQDNIRELLRDIKIPRMARYRQVFPANAMDNPTLHLRKQLENYSFLFKPGMKVAIAAGSRGIANIADYVKEVSVFLQSCGAEPFIFPAMGSHGGATAEGQIEILHRYGITQDYCKCPIISSMQTKYTGLTNAGIPVYIDKNAASADAIIVMNRIKPHTGFSGNFGSGLAKMICIGMGKQKGAESMHNAGFGVFEEQIPQYAQVVLNNYNIALGIGIIENAYDETTDIVAMPGAEILEREPVLLARAKKEMAQIFIKETDVLIVEEIGKNFAGTGMDANITGTFATPYANGGIKKKSTVVLNLSDESAGNAFGVGLANFTTKRLFDKINFSTMYPNPLTSGVLQPCYIPMVLESDDLAIKAAIKSSKSLDKPKIVYIRNTNELGEIILSEALWQEAGSSDNLEFIEEVDFNLTASGDISWIE